jgi:prepilin-type N-terminal cleavage/methylation domain-containing protein
VVNKRRQGFTLIELMAAVLIFAMVLLLLFRGFSGLSAALIQGQRRTQVSRSLAVTRDVLQEDVQQSLVSPRWPMFLSSAGPGAGEPALALLRYRQEADGTNDTEWVQYWREAASGSSNVFHWVRYAGPTLQRESVTQDWWTVVSRTDLSGEILLDAALDVTVTAMDMDGNTYPDGLHDVPPDAVDFLLAAAPEPVPPVAQLSSNFLLRARALDASWVRTRVRPKLGRGPLPEGVP